MTKTKLKQTLQPEKQILKFSIRLRHDIRIACRQLDEGEGQEDLTINQEVEAWLSK